MHIVWRDLVPGQHRVEKLSIMIHKLATRRARVLPGKYGLTDLMLALKEAEIKTESIPVHMHQGSER